MLLFSQVRADTARGDRQLQSKQEFPDLSRVAVHFMRPGTKNQPPRLGDPTQQKCTPWPSGLQAARAPHPQGLAPAPKLFRQALGKGRGLQNIHTTQMPK